MTNSHGFWITAWRKLRAPALAAVVDLGNTFILWGIVLGAHIARKAMAIVGIDPDLVELVAIGEKWVFFSSFVELFLRMLIKIVKRLYQAIKE